MNNKIISLKKFVSYFVITLIFILHFQACDNEDSLNSSSENSFCNSITSESNSNTIDCNISLTVINPIGDEQIAVEINGENERNALVNIPFNEDIDNRNFVNIAIDLNNDGSFDGYPVNTENQTEWIVRNSPIAIIPIDYNFYFSLVDSQISPEDEFTIIISVSDEIIETEGEWDGTIQQNSDFKEGVITLEKFDFENLSNSEGDAYGVGIGQNLNKIIFSTISSPNSPNSKQIVTMDGVEILMLEGVPDLPQIQNTCVISSYTNSIVHLANIFDLNISVDGDGPQGNDFQPVNLDPNDFDSVGEYFSSFFDRFDGLCGLSRKFAPGQDQNDPNVKPAGDIIGVVPANLIPAKQQILDENNVPINTTVINLDPTNPKDLIESMKDAIEDNCMVEPLLQLFDANDNRTGNHMVTLVGYSFGKAFLENEFGDIIGPDPNSFEKLVFHDANHTVFGDDGIEAQNDIYDFEINTTMNDNGAVTDGEIIIRNYTYGPPNTIKARLVGAIIECVDIDSGDDDDDGGTSLDLDFTTENDDLSLTHIKFSSNCPDPIGTVVLTNTGDVPFDWFRQGFAGIRTTPTGGQLQPGESVTLTVEFTCNPPQSVSGNLIINAMQGSASKSMSIPVSVTVN